MKSKHYPRLKVFTGLFLQAVVLLLILGCGEADTKDVLEEGPYSTPIIYTDTTIVWSSDSGIINLNRSIVIDESSMLIIEPGVHIHYVDDCMKYYADWDIEFTGPPEVRIEGGFRCNGSIEHPVIVTGGEGRHQNLDIHHNQSIHQPLVINGLHGVEVLSIVGGTPSIMYSNLRSISLEDCDSVNIERSNVDWLSAANSSGAIKKNKMSGSVLTQGGLFKIDSNIIGNDSSRGVYGFRSQHDDASILQDNVIKNYEIAVYIFSGSPTVNRNNIQDYYKPVVVIPHIENPDTDTLDFSHNWWNTQYSRDVINSIDFEVNGGTVSEKVINVLPIATVPFELDY